MTMVWPSGVIGNIQTETPVALGAPQKSPLTGSTQGGGSSVILWKLELAFPPQSNVTNVRAIRNIFAKAKQDTAVLQVRQPGISIGVTGTIRVGAGHTPGTKSLPVTGVNTSLNLFAGQFISVSTGGRWYLYTLDADSLAGSATRTLLLTSTTRAAHVNTDPVEAANPWIEGWVTPVGMTVDVNQTHNFSLAIEEAR